MIFHSCYVAETLMVNSSDYFRDVKPHNVMIDHETRTVGIKQIPVAKYTSLINSWV